MAFRDWAWRVEMRARELQLAPGSGALWSGLDRRGGTTALTGADRAAKLASRRGLTTLEMTALGRSLDKGALATLLEKDFGPDWSPQKREVFKLTSIAMAARMTGHVSIFIGQGSTKLRLFTEGAQELKAAAASAGTSARNPIAPAFTDGGRGGTLYMLESDMEAVGAKIMFDEIMELDIAGPLTGSGAVTSVSFTEVNQQDEPVSTYIMPVSHEWN